MNGEKMSKVKDNTVDDEIDIMGLLQAILYRWWIVLIAAITGFAIALATTVFLITPKYSATSMIYMRGSGNTIASLADLQIGSELTNDYQIIFTSRTLHRNLIIYLCMIILKCFDIMSDLRYYLDRYLYVE